MAAAKKSNSGSEIVVNVSAQSGAIIPQVDQLQLQQQLIFGELEVIELKIEAQEATEELLEQRRILEMVQETLKQELAKNELAKQTQAIKSEAIATAAAVQKGQSLLDRLRKKS